jgi:signal transduction histidine kinase
MLELSVRDDGAGLATGNGIPTRQGVGLSNTKSRLRHLYGDNFQFELADVSEGGLEARVIIPFSTKARVT